MIAQFVWVEDGKCKGLWCDGHAVPADQPVDYPEPWNENGEWVSVESQQAVSKATAYKKAREIMGY